MDPILIFRHVDCEGPGYFAEFLAARGVPSRLVCIDRREPIPERLEGVSTLAFRGGPTSLAGYPADLAARSPAVQPAADMLAGLAARVQHLRSVADNLYQPWLQTLRSA